MKNLNLMENFWPSAYSWPPIVTFSLAVKVTSGVSLYSLSVMSCLSSIFTATQRPLIRPPVPKFFSVTLTFWIIFELSSPLSVLTLKKSLSVSLLTAASSIGK